MSIRAFLAVNFSVPATRRLAEAAAEVRAQVRPDDSLKLAWVPAANLHVTVKFLGEIPPELAPELVLRLRRSLVNLDPFEIRATGLGGAPSLESPRVVWFDVEGGAALTKLHALVESETEGLGFAREARAFRPHVTIARVLEGAWPQTVKLQRPELATSRLSEVVLYESRPVAKGQEYVALGRIGFGALARAAG